MASSRRKPPRGSSADRPDAVRPPPRYRIELKPSAERALAALPVEHRRRVARRIDALAANPRPPGVEKLHGEDNLWRVRAGDYRIIYEVRDNLLLVLVIRIGHRREVYRRR